MKNTQSRKKFTLVALISALACLLAGILTFTFLGTGGIAGKHAQAASFDGASVQLTADSLTVTGKEANHMYGSHPARIGMITGASIRYGGHQKDEYGRYTDSGLRYGVIIAKADYDELQRLYDGSDNSANPLANGNVTTGVIIFPRDLLGDIPMTVAGLTAAGVSFIDQSPDDGKFVVEQSNGYEYYRYNIVLNKIWPSNYSRAFCARAYIQIGDQYVYSDFLETDNSRTAHQVSLDVMANEAEEDLGESRIAKLRAYSAMTESQTVGIINFYDETYDSTQSADSETNRAALLNRSGYIVGADNKLPVPKEETKFFDGWVNITTGSVIANDVISSANANGVINVKQSWTPLIGGHLGNTNNSENKTENYDNVYTKGNDLFFLDNGKTELIKLHTVSARDEANGIMDNEVFTLKYTVKGVTEADAQTILAETGKTVKPLTSLGQIADGVAFRIAGVQSHANTNGKPSNHVFSQLLYNGDLNLRFCNDEWSGTDLIGVDLATMQTDGVEVTVVVDHNKLTHYYKIGNVWYIETGTDSVATRDHVAYSGYGVRDYSFMKWATGSGIKLSDVHLVDYIDTPVNAPDEYAYSGKSRVLMGSTDGTSATAVYEDKDASGNSVLAGKTILFKTYDLEDRGATSGQKTEAVAREYSTTINAEGKWSVELPEGMYYAYIYDGGAVDNSYPMYHVDVPAGGSTEGDIDFGAIGLEEQISTYKMRYTSRRGGLYTSDFELTYTVKAKENSSHINMEDWASNGIALRFSNSSGTNVLETQTMFWDELGGTTQMLMAKNAVKDSSTLPLYDSGAFKMAVKRLKTTGIECKVTSYDGTMRYFVKNPVDGAWLLVDEASATPMGSSLHFYGNTHSNDADVYISKWLMKPYTATSEVQPTTTVSGSVLAYSRGNGATSTDVWLAANTQLKISSSSYSQTIDVSSTGAWTAQNIPHGVYTVELTSAANNSRFTLVDGATFSTLDGTTSHNVELEYTLSETFESGWVGAPEAGRHSFNVTNPSSKSFMLEYTVKSTSSYTSTTMASAGLGVFNAAGTKLLITQTGNIGGAGWNHRIASRFCDAGDGWTWENVAYTDQTDSFSVRLRLVYQNDKIGLYMRNAQGVWTLGSGYYTRNNNNWFSATDVATITTYAWDTHAAIEIGDDWVYTPLVGSVNETATVSGNISVFGGSADMTNGATIRFTPTIASYGSKEVTLGADGSYTVEGLSTACPYGVNVLDASGNVISDYVVVSGESSFSPAHTTTFNATFKFNIAQDGVYTQNYVYDVPSHSASWKTNLLSYNQFVLQFTAKTKGGVIEHDDWFGIKTVGLDGNAQIGTWDKGVTTAVTAISTEVKWSDVDKGTKIPSSDRLTDSDGVTATFIRNGTTYTLKYGSWSYSMTGTVTEAIGFTTWNTSNLYLADYKILVGTTDDSKLPSAEQAVTVEDMTVYGLYPQYVLAEGANGSDFEYFYDKSVLSISDEGLVTSKISYADTSTVKDVAVVARLKSNPAVTASFTITAKGKYSSVSNQDDKDVYRFDTAYMNKQAHVSSQFINPDGTPLEKSVLWLGDSFFDDDNYFGIFREEFSDYNAYTTGVCSSTTHELEQWVDTMVYPYKPTALVVHNGTNNVYDCDESAEQVLYSLQRMFAEIHKFCPDTQIYWLSICYRNYESALNESDIIDKINVGMKNWADSVDYATYVPLAEHFSSSGGTDGAINEDDFLDGIHLKPKQYTDVLIPMLSEYGLNCYDSQFLKSKSIDYDYYRFTDVGGYGTVTTTLNKNAQNVLVVDNPHPTGANNRRLYAALYNYKDGMYYDGAFKIKGTITKEVEYNSSNFMLLSIGKRAATEQVPVQEADASMWYDSSNVNMQGFVYQTSNIGYETYANGNYASTSTWNDLVTAKNKKSISFAVTVCNGKAYWTVEGRTIISDVPSGGAWLFVAAENVKFSMAYTLTTGSNSEISKLIEVERDGTLDYGEHSIDFGTTTKTNLIVSGKLDIMGSDYTTDDGTLYGKSTWGAHISFCVGGNSQNRFGLWDTVIDNVFGLGWTFNNTNTVENQSGSSLQFTKEDGKTLTISWKLVYADGHIYFYLNDTLGAIWLNYMTQCTTPRLRIDSENAICRFYDMQTLTGNSYNSAISELSTDLAKAKPNGTTSEIQLIK